MEKILETEFHKIKNGDWIVAINKEDNKIYDIYINIKILDKKTEKFLCSFFPNVNQGGEIIKKDTEDFSILQHKSYTFFILNKKEIKKRKVELTLNELEK